MSVVQDALRQRCLSSPKDINQRDQNVKTRGYRKCNCVADSRVFHSAPQEKAKFSSILGKQEQQGDQEGKDRNYRKTFSFTKKFQ